MAFYRIVVWVRDSKPVKGIRSFETTSLSAIQGVMYRKAESYYGGNFLDCEVQMLPKTCTAVKMFLVNKKKRRNKLDWALSQKVKNITQKETFAKEKDLVPLSNRKHI
jgi:hypothetical protein